MKVNEIRQAFLNFFSKRGHTIVPSSCLIPANDPTLLFTNSGMVQFKDVFLGKEQKNYIRATSAQKSVRAGGKHNDLENVGYTARHHTFFEMLGNFSFGDYFKQDAIKYAWELLTQTYKLPAEKLWVTVYFEDDEAYNIWLNQIGIPAQRIIKIADNKGSRYASDNFWQMADTGPCGPCSEIFYDHGDTVYGGIPGSIEEDGDRYIEIWNLVFMQYNRDEAGNLTPLPKPCVDTGMGLERISAVLQNVHSNYEIDLFVNLINQVAKVTNCLDIHNNSLKVIADHLRASCFLILDGVFPSNEGRGYVLRRILRRAIRHGYKLNVRQAFMYKLVNALVIEMGQAYPDLNTLQKNIEQVILQEEQRFFETLFNGMDILDEALKNLKASEILSGEIAFKLHDTYGFPLDLTADICRERNLKVNENEFNSFMLQQKTLARAAGKFKLNNQIEYTGLETNFTGYSQKQNISKIVALYIDNQSVNNIKAGQEGIIILEQTPFYAESGGQIGDSGCIIDNNKQAKFIVNSTHKVQNNVNGHYGSLEYGELSINQEIIANIDVIKRQAIMRNHSATHLLHKALHIILGEHIQQKGSLVDNEKLRFDFSHNLPLTKEEISHIEQQVNQQILYNHLTDTKIMPFEEAKSSGAMALFGEKYSDEVRVLNIGNSVELCGGTHVNSTGDIGIFKIISEIGISAGVRRIEAITGFNTLKYLQDLDLRNNLLAEKLKVSPSEILNKVEQIQDNFKHLQKHLQTLQLKLALVENSNLIDNVEIIETTKIKTKLLISSINNSPANMLREIADMLKDKLTQAIIILVIVENGKANLIVTVDKSLHQLIKANEIATQLSIQLEGKGGGRADMAQGGGNNINILNQALINIKDFIFNKLS